MHDKSPKILTPESYAPKVRKSGRCVAVVARKLPEWAKPADVCEKMQKMGTGTPVQKITGFEIVFVI